MNLYVGGNIYGAGNIGDDAILEGIIKVLSRLDYDFSYTIGTHHGHKLDISHPNIKYIDCYDDMEVIKSIINSDFVVCGGGTLIGDELGVSFPLKFNAELIANVKLLNKKNFIFAIGANQLNTETGTKIVKKIYSLSDVITLRDKESTLVCKNLIQNQNCNIIESVDPAFALAPKITKRTEEIKKKLDSKNKYFGVNVVNEVWLGEKGYKKIIGEVCNYIYSKYKYIPVFFCNEIRDGPFFDYEANKEVVSYLNCKYELLEPIYYNPEEMIEIISNFQFILAMRMHALIFASLTNTPFVSISRVDKVDNFMKLFDSNLCYSIKKLDCMSLIQSIETVIEQKSIIENNINDKVVCLRNKSFENALLFKLFIEDNKKSKPIFNAYSLKFIKYKALLKNLI